MNTGLSGYCYLFRFGISFFLLVASPNFCSAESSPAFVEDLSFLLADSSSSSPQTIQYQSSGYDRGDEQPCCLCEHQINAGPGVRPGDADFLKMCEDWVKSQTDCVWKGKRGLDTKNLGTCQPLAKECKDKPLRYHYFGHSHEELGKRWIDHVVKVCIDSSKVQGVIAGCSTFKDMADVNKYLQTIKLPEGYQLELWGALCTINGIDLEVCGTAKTYYGCTLTYGASPKLDPCPEGPCYGIDFRNGKPGIECLGKDGKKTRATCCHKKDPNNPNRVIGGFWIAGDEKNCPPTQCKCKGEYCTVIPAPTPAPSPLVDECAANEDCPCAGGGYRNEIGLCKCKQSEFEYVFYKDGKGCECSLDRGLIYQKDKGCQCKEDLVGEIIDKFGYCRCKDNKHGLGLASYSKGQCECLPNEVYIEGEGCACSGDLVVTKPANGTNYCACPPSTNGLFNPNANGAKCECDGAGQVFEKGKGCVCAPGYKLTGDVFKSCAKI